MPGRPGSAHSYQQRKPYAGDRQPAEARAGKREQQGKDKRFVLACITPAGEKLIARIFPEHARRITEVLGRLKPDEQEQLGILCRKLGKGVK